MIHRKKTYTKFVLISFFSSLENDASGDVVGVFELELALDRYEILDAKWDGKMCV